MILSAYLYPVHNIGITQRGGNSLGRSRSQVGQRQIGKRRGIGTILIEMSTRRVAIVTGGTKGIGRGISESLAEDGFDLLLNYNSDETGAEKVSSEIGVRYPNTRCTLVGGDISLKETRNSIFKAFDELQGDAKLGVMVHNAGQYVGLTSTNIRQLDIPTHQFGDGASDGISLVHIEYYQAMYGNAFIDLCERSIARMHNVGDNDSDGGTLIGISSPGCNLTYSVQKGYDMPGSGKCVMEYACRVIAKKAGTKNINCNIIIPGITRSNAWEKIADSRGKNLDDMMEKAAPFVPMNRVTEPREIGSVVSFLCSPKGRYITGIALPVDGGLHLN